MFEKMGEAGWKALIPIYNIYILCKKTSKISNFYKLMITYIIIIILALLVDFKIILLEEGNTLGSIISIIFLIVIIYAVIVEIKTFHGLSKSFGHSAGFTVGLILLNFIFQLILGYGESKYKKIN